MSIVIDRSACATRQSVRGFTLIELIVTVAVVAILATLALPNFGTSIRNSRLTSTTNDLLTAINLARNEAITRTRGMSICAADVSAGVPAACGTSTDWSKGWVVFVDDSAGTTAPTTIAAAGVVRAWTAGESITVTPTPVAGFIRFSPRGESVAGERSFSIVPSDACSGKQQRLINVAAMGRANSKLEDCP